jgi:3-hydroxyacyl-CoA dehydrogenase
MEANKRQVFGIIGVGTIGLSFVALHLNKATDPLSLQIFLYDPRPNLKAYVQQHLPGYLDPQRFPEADKDIFSVAPIYIAETLAQAVGSADVVQEQGPENLPFKEKVWHDIEEGAPETAALWSSTSGIPASLQSQRMKNPERLLIVHPYNPPHIMPLIEVVPSPLTSQASIDVAMTYFESIGHTPILIKKEIPGFVVNRLAFSLFRECVHLVNEDVISVPDLDRLVQSSMGPRLCVNGPFKSYHEGGGAGGIGVLLTNISATIQNIWDTQGRKNMGEVWEQR